MLILMVDTKFFTFSGGNTAETAGNKLLVSNFQGKAQSIGNFESMRFESDLNDISWGQGADSALLSLEGGIDNSDENLTSTVDLHLLSGEKLEEGETYTVVSGTKAETLQGDTLNIQTNGLIKVDASWDNQTTGELNIRVDAKGGGEDSGLVNVPDVAAAMMIAEGGLMLDQLMPKKGLFAIAQASTSETDMNADIETDSFNLMTGVAGDFETAPGLLRVATFIEYGDGDYDAKRNASRSDGDIYFYDAGIQGTLFADNGLINELSFRFGRVHSDGTMQIDDNQSLKLKKESSFITAHAGLGWQGEVADGLMFNPYARYHYLRIKGDEATIEGAPLKWDSYLVQRTLVGAKLKYLKGPQWNWEVGAAWESVFDADVSATYDGVALDAWNMEGDSAVLHGAVSYQFESHPEWNLEVAAKGKFGDYEGYAGKITLWRVF